ncbi:sodium:solute symporter family protein [candidate division KSB1 bacterium]|nr:sodium:solute symporter family protein [candidate division KSB1 bacterium]
MLEKLSKADIIIILGYFIFIIGIGFRIARDRGKDISQFLLAGRQLTLPSFIATLVSTWYGGILGVGEFSYRYGISNWLVFGVPYYIAAALFALFLAKKARRLELYTIPDQLARCYGKTASIVGAGFVFVMTVPAAYVLMLAILLQFLFGWSLMVGLIIGTLFSTCYVLAGGFRSVVRTDVLQFSLMFGSFMMILPFAVYQYGGWEYLSTHLPATHFIWHGGNGAQYIFVWYFIALATLVEPSFYQRCFAAKDEQTARRGILYSILFWIFFDFMTTFTGLYARAILTSLADPVTAYLDLGVKVLPPVALGLFITGLLSTIMSTIDSYSFLAAMTFGRDLIWRLKENQSEETIQKYTRWGLLLNGVLAIGIAFLLQSVIRIWKDVGSVGTPALLIPLASSFSSRFRMTKFYAILSMLGSASISGLWIASRNAHWFGSAGKYLLGLEPIYPGLAFSILIYLMNQIHLRLKIQSGS